MAERIEHKNIFVALAAAQAEMEPAVKGSTNPHFKSKYADLADVVAVVRPALTRHGICFHHEFVGGEGTQYMRTALTHGATDTDVFCDVPLIVGQSNMQGFKSATTYAKRIGLESVTGIAPEDDDGNAAAEAAPKSNSNGNGQKKQTNRWTKSEETKAVFDKMQTQINGVSTVAKLREWGEANKDTIDKLPEDWQGEIRACYSFRQDELKSMETYDEYAHNGA